MNGSGILASSLLVVAGALLLVVVVVVHARDVTTTLEYRGDEPLPATGTDTRPKADTASMRDHRQGRMSLHAEVPSSKVKREQALRNILAARRRQILSQRPIELSTSPTGRTLRSDGSYTWRDGSDMLEAQETRHAMYVAASGKTRASMEEETSEVLTAVEEKSGSKPTGVVEEPALKEADSGVGRQVAEQQSSRKAGDENSTSSSSAESKPAFGNSRSNYSIGHRNSSGLAPHSSPTSSSLVGPKAGESESRRKNTVPMPESLYNYFRPVESNIPVEDMSQFLYFGQKIQPESQNSTNNNTVEVTPTAPSLPSSRRRYSMKRFSTTTPVPVPKLEDIINEEMNIAVERQTVEKNKIPKLKNGFRSPESGIYYRKPRPTEVTLASNVIAELEGGSTPSSALADKFLQDDNPSAHAASREQLQNASERGSGAAHVPPETRNATNSTQILHQQPVSASMYEESTTESEISLKDHPTDMANKAPLTSNGVAATKLSKKGPRRRKIDNMTLDPDVASITTSSWENLDKESSTVIPGVNDAGKPTPTDTEMHGYSEQKVRRADGFEVNDATELSKNEEEQMQMDQSHTLGTRENNNIETSTLREKLSRSTSGSQYPMAWMSLAGRSETSTLRIIVTEENYRRSSPIPSDPIERNTVKPVDSTLERVRSSASGLVATSKLPTAPSAGLTIVLGSERTSGGESQGQQQNHQQQQHVYAYTITNVTRLLRNYTGPGLSIEEQGGGPERSSGAAEITTGSPDRPEPPPPPPPPPSPSSSSSPLLPRAGSGIEASRAPAELSAGTTVEPATAGGAFTADSSQVGERPRKVAAVAQQQRAPASRGTLPGHLSVNKNAGSRSPRPAEVTTRGTVRWNHTKNRGSELEHFGDRRLLRKSASAVLNQRIGGASSDDDVTFTKRRRVLNGQSAPSIGGRRLKGPGLSKTPEEAAMGTTNRPVGFNQSTANSEKKADTGDQKVEGTDRVSQEASLAAARQGLKIGVTKSETLNGTAIDQAQNATSVSGSSAVTLESTSTRLPSDMIEADSNLTEAFTSQNFQNNTKDQSIVAGVENDARLAPNVNEISSSSVLVTSVDNPSGSSTVTVTDAESPGAKETTTPSSTVTASTPVFPVTPETHAEAGRVSIEKETFTLKPTEPESQVTGTKTTEANGAPDAVVHLEPAEIQRMYRSKNVTTTTPPTPPSTRIPEARATIGSKDLGMPGDLTKLQEKIASGANPRKRVSSERSPEVRARNLSDKSKDKDDVLPIMQLYNTSNMFNASGTVDAFSRGTERSPAELPVNVEGEKQREASRTTEKSNGAETWSRSAGSVPTNPTRTSQGKDGSTSTQTSSRRDKSEENRETSSHVAPTGPGRGSSFVNASAANRTRHRPVFTPSVLPEYNGSLYPVDLNRTFFETGLISVSPSEAVNISEGISKRPNSDAVATQETVAVVSYILATLVVFPIAVGVGLILRRLILRNRKVLEESDTSSEISCRKDALNLENGDFKTSIEKAITKLPRIQHLCLEAEKPPPPSTPKSRWEFPRDKLRLQTVLGQGNFGQVWKAEADDLTGHQGTTRLVAVKTVKEGASEREKEDLVQELEIMQQLGSHPNVVTLLGCCTEQEPHYLILEYVMYGKLLAYLRDHRTRQDFYNFSEDSAALTSRDLTVFGYCVARGMEYLASKKIIHRDLAARNVLVDHNKLCKIADFGMSLFANEDGEVIETRHGRNALPIRWMAPESLIYSLFTTKTDVWSFGILMWEIVTLGSTPYPDMTAREVMRNVQNGYRLERPSHCRSELFRVISRCWHADPDRRPEFQTLRRDMAQLLEDNKNGHYVDLESFASECTD